ncbi:hypothetical protein I6J32_00140 (plasmid) [Moraxella osloensis]|nr:hypothetical protein [Moraxella osloensis]QRO12249.1 hypothetical protein I6J32_00140 [Moraxella osloensis]
MSEFSEQLAELKKQLNFTQVQMCKVLYGVPQRTLQSWLQDEKLPPDYVKKLIIIRLNSLIDSSKVTDIAT